MAEDSKDPKQDQKFTETVKALLRTPPQPKKKPGKDSETNRRQNQNNGGESPPKSED